MNIGAKIEEVCRAKSMGVTRFSRLLNTSRSNVYSIFRRASIDTGQLYTICEILDYNFFALLSNQMVRDEVLKTPLPELECLEEQLPAYRNLVRERDLFRNKLVVLEEEIKSLKSRLRDKDEIIALQKHRLPH